MKLVGIVSGGPYAGQKYYIVRPSGFPRWVEVNLGDENGRRANREVPEKFLESE